MNIILNTSLALFSYFSFSILGIAQENVKLIDCTYFLDPGRVKVKWEGFQTPSKTPLRGKFNSIELTGTTQGESVMTILKGIRLNISTDSIFTRSETRDRKISKQFFSNLKGGAIIQGEVSKIEKSKLYAKLTMNGQTRTVPMDFLEWNGNFRAIGVIDILDFQLSSELKKITNALKNENENKYWSDVNIEVQARFKKKCTKKRR